jgi:hypothetical protein
MARGVKEPRRRDEDRHLGGQPMTVTGTISSMTGRDGRPSVIIWLSLAAEVSMLFAAIGLYWE